MVPHKKLICPMIKINIEHPTTMAAITVWGAKGQIAILQEECAELISATARFNRERTGTDPVAEEVADVIVSLMSVINVLDIEEQVKLHMNHKIKRLERRINEISSTV